MTRETVILGLTAMYDRVPTNVLT